MTPCPSCGCRLELAGALILYNGWPVYSCPGCLAALAVEDGQIVLDITVTPCVKKVSE